MLAGYSVGLVELGPPYEAAPPGQRLRECLTDVPGCADNSSLRAIQRDPTCYGINGTGRLRQDRATACALSRCPHLWAIEGPVALRVWQRPLAGADLAGSDGDPLPAAGRPVGRLL